MNHRDRDNARIFPWSPWPLALALVGLTINGWFARSLGATDFAGWLFLAVGLASDLSALLLPDAASRLWRSRQLIASAVAWSLWLLTFGFALVASVGFASLNITEVIATRANRSTAAIVEIEQSLADARKARDQECAKLGPVCRSRQDTVAGWEQKLADARQALVLAADPQTLSAAHLVAWISRGPVAPSSDDLAEFRLALLVVLPQLGSVACRKGIGPQTAARRRGPPC